MGRVRANDDRGQAAPLLVGVLAVGLVMLVAVARVGEAAVDAARARTAADAAALAGAVRGAAAATEAAAANGATIVWLRHEGVDVIVKVKVASAAAEARATLRVDPRRS